LKNILIYDLAVGVGAIHSPYYTPVASSHQHFVEFNELIFL